MIGVGFVFGQVYNNPLILYAFVSISILMNVFSYWYSDKVVIAMSHAKPASRKEYFDLYTVVENLSITAGLPMPKVYIINDSAPNAFATGRNKEHAVVAVTSGLLNMLDRSELEGVVGHELSHIGNRDILLSTVIVVLVGLISIISDFFLRSQFWFGGIHDRDDNRSSGAMVLIGIVLSILAPIVAMLIQLAVSRKREFLADSSSVLLTRYPEGLARALEKIGSYSKPMSSASNATAHLFISNPFGRQAFSGLHKLFMTHPPIGERIKVLRSGGF